MFVMLPILTSMSIGAKEARANSDCSVLADEVGTTITRILSTETDLAIGCQISKEKCNERIALSRKGISLARRGIQMIKGDSNCSNNASLMSKLVQYEKKIDANEIIVNKYDSQPNRCSKLVDELGTGIEKFNAETKENFVIMCLKSKEEIKEFIAYLRKTTSLSRKSIYLLKELSTCSKDISIMSKLVQFEKEIAVIEGYGNDFDQSYEKIAVNVIGELTERLKAETDLATACQSSKEKCNERIASLRKSISILREGIRHRKGDSKCKEDISLMNKLVQNEKDIIAIEKVVNKYDSL